jgi:TP901 family phage tail tape measure protein
MAAAGQVRAGRAYVELNAKDNMAGALARAAAKLKAFGASVQSVGTQMAVFSAVAATPFVASAVAFASFEQTMARVKALTNANATDFQRLGDAAKRLGETTVFSASQAAEAMSYFALAGYDVDKILGAIGPTLNLAAAGQLGMAQSADIVAKIMSGMGVPVTQVAHAVDVLTKAMTTANTDLPQLGDAMKYVGPIAKTAGVAFEEIVAAIQLLSNAGIQGEMAGTTLRGAILSLTSPSEQARKEMAALGVQVTDSAGNVRSLADIIGQFETALAGMGSGTRLDILGRIFDTRQAAGVAELLNQGSGALAQRTAALAGSAGTAARIAATQLDTLKGSATLLLSVLEGVAIAVGEALVGPLRSLSAILSNVAGVMIEWIRANQGIVLAIAATVVGVGALGVGLIALGLTIKAAVTVGTALVAVFGLIKAAALAAGAVASAAFALIASPAGIAVAAIMAIGAAIAYATGTLSNIGTFASSVFGYIGRLAAAVGADIKLAFEGIVDALKSGDFALAGEIAMTGLRLAFARATYDIRVMWTNMVHDLSKSLMWLQNRVEKVMNWWTNKLVIGAASTVELMADMAGMGDVATSAAAMRALMKGRTQAQNSAADEFFNQSIKALEQARKSAVGDIGSGLEKLAEDLRRLRDKARPVEKPDEMQAPEPPPPPQMPELRTEGLAQVAAAVQESATKLRAIGTFNVAAAAGVAGAVTAVQNRIANATQQTAENTASILAALQDGGASFA